ncbi:MAG: type II secretion system protein N [Gammaproteobacteria bacterium]|nr:type II secretion system protein N [Gammaproteobacteria bacterium]
MKKKHYIILAISSYLLFTLAYTPAASIISLLEKSLPLPVKIYGVSGSIWNGHADRLLGQLKFPVTDINWSLNFLPLLTGSLSADINASVKQQAVSGQLALSLLGGLSANNIKSEIPAMEMQQLIDIPIGEFAGKFILDIESAQMNPQGLPQLDATIYWQDAKFTLAQTVDLGQVLLDIKPDNKQGLLAKLTNKNAKLGIEGTINIHENKQYVADISFTAKDRDPAIQQSLAMFAKKQTNGSYRLQKSGNINQLGF